MASPISATMPLKRCWTTERVIGSTEAVIGADCPRPSGQVNSGQALFLGRPGCRRFFHGPQSGVHRPHPRQTGSTRKAQGFEELFGWHRVQLGQLTKRQFRLPIRQRKADNNILTTKLAPKRIRRPFLRLLSTQTLDPDKVPLSHNERPGPHLG